MVMKQGESSSAEDEVKNLKDALEEILREATIGVQVRDLNYVDLKDILESIKDKANSILKYSEEEISSLLG